MNEETHCFCTYGELNLLKSLDCLNFMEFTTVLPEDLDGESITCRRAKLNALFQ